MVRNAEQVLAVSRPIAPNAAGLGAAKVKAVHNGVSAVFLRVRNSASHSSKPTVKWLAVFRFFRPMWRGRSS
jgi:hypothetical protein